jgi:hypothetical protein
MKDKKQAKNRIQTNPKALERPKKAEGPIPMLSAYKLVFGRPFEEDDDR